jgi:hypothetical protein
MPFGTRLVCGAYAPSPLAGKGGMGETLDIEVTPGCTPTPALPRRGGGILLALLTRVVPNSIEGGSG